MTPDDIAALFTSADGRFRIARWGRPIAPVVFGVGDATLPIVKGAIEAVVTLAGHRMAETDPELGANLWFFFLRDWQELAETPNLDRIVPDLGAVVARLQAAQANQYRLFRFDRAGAIQACFVFLRMDESLSGMPAESLALSQAVQAMLLWSDRAFAERSPLALTPGGATVLRPEIGAVVRAAYDRFLPAASDDAVLALRLYARMGAEG